MPLYIDWNCSAFPMVEFWIYLCLFLHTAPINSTHAHYPLQIHLCQLHISDCSLNLMFLISNPSTLPQLFILARYLSLCIHIPLFVCSGQVKQTFHTKMQWLKYLQCADCKNVHMIDLNVWKNVHILIWVVQIFASVCVLSRKCLCNNCYREYICQCNTFSQPKEHFLGSL